MAKTECRWESPNQWSEWIEWLAAGLQHIRAASMDSRWFPRNNSSETTGVARRTDQRGLPLTTFPMAECRCVHA